MFKKGLSILFGGILSLSVCFTSFAGWRSDGNGWWFDNGNGTWPASCWLWVDGNQDGQAECYYFQQNGYILTNASTPDGYIVDGNGAWVVNGVVQRRATGGATNQNKTTGNAKRDSNKITDTTTQSNTQDSDRVALYNLKEVQASYWAGKSSAEKTVQGKLLSDVIELCSDEYIEFYAGGEYNKLRMVLAPKEGYREDYTCIVQVFGDDNELINESDEINYRTKPFELEADITGQQFIRIKSISDLGDRSYVLLDNAEFCK